MSGIEPFVNLTALGLLGYVLNWLLAKFSKTIEEQQTLTRQEILANTLVLRGVCISLVTLQTVVLTHDLGMRSIDNSSQDDSCKRAAEMYSALKTTLEETKRVLQETLLVSEK